MVGYKSIDSTTTIKILISNNQKNEKQDAKIESMASMI